MSSQMDGHFIVVIEPLMGASKPHCQRKCVQLWQCTDIDQKGMCQFQSPPKGTMFLAPALLLMICVTSLG